MRARLLARRIFLLAADRVILCALIFMALTWALLSTKSSLGAAPLTADITCTSSTGGTDCDVFNVSPKITAVKAQGSCEPDDTRPEVSLALSARPRCSGMTETTNVTMTGSQGGPGIDGQASTAAGRLGVTVRRQVGRSYCDESSPVIGAVEEPNPCPPEPQPAPTPTPQLGCTTQGSDGSCPPDTYPDGAGMCCSGGFCGGGALTATGDAPSTNMAPGPFPGPGGCGCDPAERTGCYSGGGEWSETYCSCVSPVLVDVDGDGFALTGGAGGVAFDITADGLPDRISWTAAGADDAWLALDRDGDGMIRSGAELFGNFTPQPAPPAGGQRNGFLALAVYDRAGNGGNGDGVIAASDAIYSSLRLWRDANHDGVSQPAELFTLAALDVVRLHLDYKESKRVDEHGNRFLYRAKLDDARGAKAGRWAWDVFLVRGQ